MLKKYRTRRKMEEWIEVMENSMQFANKCKWNKIKNKITQILFDITEIYNV